MKILQLVVHGRNVLILQVREGVGSVCGLQEMSSCSHILLTPVEEQLLRTTEHTESHLKSGALARLRIPIYNMTIDIGT